MSIGFDGTGEAVLGNDPIETAHTITGDITVRLWCQFNNAPSVAEAIISTGESGSTTESENALYEIRRTTAGYFQWRHENGAGINTIIGFDSANDYGVVPLGWEGYVCCVRDSVAKTVTLYVDGVRYSTRSYTNNPTGGTSGRLAFGGIWNGTGVDSNMDGRVGEAVIYNVALSDNDAIDLSRGVSPEIIDPDDIVSYWKLQLLSTGAGGSDRTDTRGVDDLAVLNSAYGSTRCPQPYFSREIPWTGGDEADVKFIQEAQGADGNPLTSVTLNFDKPTTIGNILIAAIVFDKDSGNIEFNQGWQRLNEYNSGLSVTGACAWKRSDGTETGFDWQWATSVSGTATYLAEIEGLIDWNADTVNDSGETAVSTISSGALNIQETSNHVFSIGIHGIDTIDYTVAPEHAYHKRALINSGGGSCGLGVFTKTDLTNTLGGNTALRVSWTGGADQAVIFLNVFNARGKRKKESASFIPPSLIQHRPPGVKPVGPVKADLHHPLTKYMIRGLIFQERAGHTTTDLSPLGGSCRVDDTVIPWGEEIDLGSTGNAVWLSGHNNYLGSYPEGTILFRCKATDTTPSSSASLFVTTGDYTKLCVYRGASNTNLNLCAGTIETNEDVTTDLWDGEFHDVAFHWDITGNWRYLWIDGSFEAEANVGNMNSVDLAGGLTLGEAGVDPSGLSFTYCYLFSYWLPDLEKLSIFKDPYQMLIPANNF